MLEAKLRDEVPSPQLTFFKDLVPEAQAVQLAGRLRRKSRRQGIEISRAADWLTSRGLIYFDNSRGLEPSAPAPAASAATGASER